MKAADWINRLSAPERKAYAESAGLSRTASVEALSAALTDPARVRRALDGLPAPARDALVLLAVGFGGRADRNTLVRELTRMHPTSAGEAVAELERAGLLAPRSVNAWLSELVEESAPDVHAAAVAWLTAAAQPWVPAAEERLVADPMPAVADTARLLAAMSDGVRIRQQGGVFQADQRRLAQLFDHSRPHLPPGLSHPWEGYVSEFLALHLALVIQLDLLETDERGWRTAAAAETWLHLPPAQQWASLVQAWVDIGDHRLEGRFADLLAAFREGQWVDLDRWRGHLARYVHTYPPLPAAAEALLVRPGLALGAIAIGATADRTVFRLTPPALAVLSGKVPEWPQPVEPVVIEADFEVTIPTGAPARLVWDLERWAHRVRVDRVARYRITRETVQRRSRLGEPVEPWLERLAAAGRYGVPENVHFALVEWAVPVRRAAMGPVVALRFVGGPPEGWSPPAGAQPAGPGLWLLDLPAAVKEAGALRKRGVILDGAPEEWTAMERAAAEHRRRSGEAPLSLPWPGPHTADPRTEVVFEG
ncbi:MAG TPA: hypothetical protein VNM16_12065 [Bacillota bacterium]|nr:hypothetical protein [Bacillota bacterium]